MTTSSAAGPLPDHQDQDELHPGRRRREHLHPGLRAPPGDLGDDPVRQQFSETVPFPKADIFNPTIRNVYLDNVNTSPTMTQAVDVPVLEPTSRSPVENVYYRNSVFHTNETLQSAFNNNKNIKNLVVENVTYINPTTQARTVYNTAPLNLLDETKSVFGERATVLVPASIGNPNFIKRSRETPSRVSGKVDLSTYPGVRDRWDGKSLRRSQHDGDRGDAERRWVVPEQLVHAERQPDLVQRSALCRGQLLQRPEHQYHGVSDREACARRRQQRWRPQLPGPDDGGQAIGTRTGQPGFLLAADIDSNGVVDQVDLKLIRAAIARTPGFSVIFVP